MYSYSYSYSNVRTGAPAKQLLYKKSGRWRMYGGATLPSRGRRKFSIRLPGKNRFVWDPGILDIYIYLYSMYYLIVTLICCYGLHAIAGKSLR